MILITKSPSTNAPTNGAQCKELLNDLFENYEDHREDDYFCGSLVFIQSDKDNKTDIVDGQQRLSTFILLAKVLATLYSERLDPKIQEYLQESWSDRHEDGEKKKRKRLDFDLVGSSAKKDFQDALDFFDDLDASKGENSKSNDPSKGKNSYLKNAICLKNYLEKKRLQTLTLSFNGCILRSISSPSPALIPTWH